jgi:CelD/BcsL family acetyltransferase involved in cellulose biosynthesis
VTVVVETGTTALRLLDGRWDELVARQRVPNPTLSAAWLRALAEWPGGTPLVAVAEADGRLEAGIALQLRRRAGLRTATWLGPVEQLCSPELLADRPEAGAAVLAAALEHTDVLTLAAAEGWPTIPALAAAAPWHRREPLGLRWWTAWPPERHDYACRRAGRHLRRAERLGAAVDVRVAAAPGEVSAALVRLFRLHRARWDARGDETLRFARTHALRRWNARAVSTLAAYGRVRIAEVVEDGRIVASCLGLLHGHGALGHTQAIATGTTINEAGHIALLACLEALADAGATVVDLGPGRGQPGSPKHRLGPEAAPVFELFATRTPSAQRVLATAQRLRRVLA